MDVDAISQLTLYFYCHKYSCLYTTKISWIVSILIWRHCDTKATTEVETTLEIIDVEENKNKNPIRDRETVPNIASA